MNRERVASRKRKGEAGSGQSCPTPYDDQDRNRLRWFLWIYLEIMNNFTKNRDEKQRPVLRGMSE